MGVLYTKNALYNRALKTSVDVVESVFGGAGGI